MAIADPSRIKEGELEFHFPGCTVERFDHPGRPTPQGMKLVDFVINLGRLPDLGWRTQHRSDREQARSQVPRQLPYFIPDVP